MAIDLSRRQNQLPPDLSDDDGAYYGLHGDWNEKIVTAVATGLAILVVATVALLMGRV